MLSANISRIPLKSDLDRPISLPVFVKTCPQVARLQSCLLTAIWLVPTQIFPFRASWNRIVKDFQTWIYPFAWEHTTAQGHTIVTNADWPRTERRMRDACWRWRLGNGRMEIRDWISLDWWLYRRCIWDIHSGQKGLPSLPSPLKACLGDTANAIFYIGAILRVPTK